MLIGLVGKPSVGKSTFFKASTMADVAIAPHPFTTIKPNHGIAYVKVDCIDTEFKVQCNPNHGFCIEGKRFVPVELMDVAGLVRGASEGKGLGNKFLDDLREADAFIQIVDISGRTDAEGKLLPEGSKVKLLGNYYVCNEAKRGDIAEYKYPGSENPIAKVVKAVPGDTFALQKSGSGWNILINGKAATNSEGKPYAVGDRAYRMLSLYVKDYRGVIPTNAYVILGEDPGGSLDSTQFGLVDKSDFAGKVVKE